jgi:hypothetical protein
LRAVEAKATRTLSAFSSTTGFSRGMSQAAGRKLYVAIARPIITYGASAWYTPTSIKGHRNVVNNKFLRLITGSYRVIATEAVEIKTHIQPMDIFIDRY